jgi:hypothetical protein
MKLQRSEVTVDTSQWSELSQRKLGYLSAPAVYEDLVFHCRRCKRADVFTAKQQKHEYEIKKAHTLRQRVLCGKCFQEKHQLIAAESDYAAQREQAGTTDVPTLLQWIEVLELLVSYGVRRNTARINQLRRLAENAA